jgi:hypothetical protein
MRTLPDHFAHAPRFAVRKPGWGPKLNQMSKKRTAWVLDTETKGTGVEMVPLERLEERKRLRGERERIRVIGPKAAEPAGEPVFEGEEPRAPRRFRILDVRSRQALADDVGISEALEALRGVGSVVDVNVFVWDSDEEDWRPLTMSERRRLWNLRSPGMAPEASTPAPR